MLAGELKLLVGEGKIASEAANAAMARVWKISSGGMNALLKLGGEVRDRLMQHGTERPPRPRKVKLK
jgi:DNA-binding CsgD family transcriptional regulator